MMVIGFTCYQGDPEKIHKNTRMYQEIRAVGDNRATSDEPRANDYEPRTTNNNRRTTNVRGKIYFKVTPYSLTCSIQSYIKIDSNGFSLPGQC